jgi:hypothetical protein
MPLRDLTVSPQHRVLIVSDRAELAFGAREVLKPARHLAGRPGIETLAPERTPAGTRDVRFLCDRHEIVLSEGQQTKGSQPGEAMLDVI